MLHSGAVSNVLITLRRDDKPSRRSVMSTQLGRKRRRVPNDSPPPRSSGTTSRAAFGKRDEGWGMGDGGRWMRTKEPCALDFQCYISPPALSPEVEGESTLRLLPTRYVVGACGAISWIAGNFFRPRIVQSAIRRKRANGNTVLHERRDGHVQKHGIRGVVAVMCGLAAVWCAAADEKASEKPASPAAQQQTKAMETPPRRRTSLK